MRRAVLPILLAPLILLASALSAQEGFTGRFTFSQYPGGNPLISFELAERGGTVTGIGQSSPDLPGIGATVVTVTGGATFDRNLQLQLELQPFNTARRPTAARFQVIDGSDPVASLIFDGQTINGVLVPQNGGAAPPAGTACKEMEELTDILNAGASTDVVQIIRGIYADAGLAFGGRQTPDRCTRVLEDLYGLVIDLEEGGADDAMACEAVDSLLTDIFAELDQLGVFESGELDGILANAGLQVTDLNPNGVWNAANCTRAIPGLETYLDRVRAAPSGTGSGFVSEPMAILPVYDFTPAVGGGDLTLWSHNGSEMGYETGRNEALTIWYWTPRAGLSDVGVRRGTILFEGWRSGTLVEGTARIFTRDCGTYPYPVEGTAFGGASTLTMTGLRPVIDGQCRVSGTRPDTLTFTFVGAGPGSAPAPRPQPQPQVQNPVQSSGNVLIPLDPATASDLVRNDGVVRADPDDDLGEPEFFDTPGFGVWAEYYEVYGVRDTLNVRSGPGTRYGVTSELPPYARNILMIGSGCTPDLDQALFSQIGNARQAQLIADRWCNIDWNGQRGWVYGRYIRPYAP